MFLQPTYRRVESQFVNACKKRKEKLVQLLSMKINDETNALYSVERRCLTNFFGGKPPDPISNTQSYGKGKQGQLLSNDNLKRSPELSKNVSSLVRN